jgi:hypothetical protein
MMRGWDEINARPSKLRPFGSALVNGDGGTVERCPVIGRTRRLRAEPPCPSCGNKSAWQCECEGEDA